MPFKKGKDPNRNVNGRPVGSKNKNRAIRDWDEINGAYSLQMLDRAMVVVRRGSDTASRQMSIKLLTLHKKIIDGKMEASEEFAAELLKRSRELVDNLHRILRSNKVTETNKTAVINFFLENSLEAAKKEAKDTTEEDDFSQPVLSLVAVGGDNVVPLEKKKK